MAGKRPELRDRKSKLEGLETEEENKFLCTISKGLEMEQKVGNQCMDYL